MEVVADGKRVRETLSSNEILFASGCSGAFTRSVCQPLDVLKIRLQLHADGQSSLFHSFKSLLEREGIRGFWKGHNSAQALSIVYGLGQFGVYGLLSKHFPNHDSKWETFAKGYAAGLSATLLSYPFDVVRTRIVAQGTHHEDRYRGSFEALVKMSRHDRSALFRGFMPTVLAQAPYSGFQFLFYKLFFSFWKNNFGDSGSWLLSGSTVCGTLAGLASKLIVFPLDTVKKQMQVTGFANYQRNMRFISTITYLWKSGGVLRFYNGLSPGLIKAMATTCVNFVSYEYICLAIWKYRHSTDV